MKISEKQVLELILASQQLANMVLTDYPFPEQKLGCKIIKDLVYAIEGQQSEELKDIE